MIVMVTDNITQDKSYSFAIRIVKAYKFLTNERKEFVLSKQLLRSGTAIGALVREGVHAQSRPDFLNNDEYSIERSVRNRILDIVIA